MFQKVATFIEIRNEAITDLIKGNKNQNPTLSTIGIIKSGGKDMSIAPESISDQIPYNDLLKWIAERTNLVQETKMVLHKESVLRTKRRFGEIDNNHDLKFKCLIYKKYCAIGILADSNWNNLIKKEDLEDNNSTINST